MFRLGLRGASAGPCVRRYRILSECVVQIPTGLPFLPIRNPGKGCHTSPILAPTIDVILPFDLLPVMLRVLSTEQMYVDPELLDELTKEQKEILFHKVSRDSVQSPCPSSSVSV